MMSMTMMVGMLMIMTDHTTYKNKDVSKSCVIFVKLPELHQSFWGAENSHGATQAPDDHYDSGENDDADDN